MSLSANERLHDIAVKHQIDLQRYAANLVSHSAKALKGSRSKLERLVIHYATSLEGIAITSASAKQMLSEFERELSALRLPDWQAVEEFLSGEFKGFIEHESELYTKTLDAVSPVDLSLAALGAAAVRDIASGTLIIGKTLNQWMTKLATADIERMSTALKTALVQNESTKQIQLRVIGPKSGKGGAYNRAFTDLVSVIHTAVSSYHDNVRRASNENNRHAIAKERFYATLDSRTTLTCSARDGKVFPLGEGPHPPLHFRCRSVRVGFLDHSRLRERPFNPTTEKNLAKQYAKSAGLDGVESRDDLPRGHRGKFDEFARARKRALIGVDPGRTTYTDFLRRQSPEFQDEVLGPTRAQAFREGKASLGKFISRNGNVLTLDQLRQRGVDI